MPKRRKEPETAVPAERFTKQERDELTAARDTADLLVYQLTCFNDQLLDGAPALPVRLRETPVDEALIAASRAQEELNELLS